MLILRKGKDFVNIWTDKNEFIASIMCDNIKESDNGFDVYHFVLKGITVGGVDKRNVKEIIYE